MIRLVSPLFVLYTLWRALKDGGLRYLLERLGVYSSPLAAAEDNSGILWIHAASVGEVFTVLPLLKALDNQPLLVTTVTPTGAQVLAQQGLSHVQHHYLPVDFSGACHRFFKRTNIRSGWIVETEIWPWLYARAKCSNIELSIINARLSDKTSSQANGFLATTFQQALAGVRVLARSNDDAARFMALGAEQSRVAVVGNLKYAISADNHVTACATSPVEQPYVLAASTHADEELQLSIAWQKHLQEQHGALLVIVPRHPERGSAIQKQLAERGIVTTLRSKNEPVPTGNGIYIADTLGELQAWYSHTNACFVGGSLIKRGGHNVLEPARLDCAVIVGPHTFNFADIIATFLEQDALMVADNADDVVRFLQDAVENPQALEPMVQRAHIQAKRSEDVLALYLTELLGEAAEG